MQWNQSTMYEQRVRFILEVQQRTFSFAEGTAYPDPLHNGATLMVAGSYQPSRDRWRTSRCTCFILVETLRRGYSLP